MISKSRPDRFWIRVPSRIVERLNGAPEWVRQTFTELLDELQRGAYPEQHPSVALARGTSRNAFVVWKDGVQMLYFITLDQPVIVVVGVHWRDDPNGGDDGEPGWDWDGTDYTLAA